MTTVAFQKSTVREYFESIVVAVILALFIRTFVVQAFKIPTGSMEPNLLVGDHLLVNKFVFSPAATGVERTLLPVRPVERGDVVVFKYPEDPERDFIKRIVGLPGETVEVKGTQVLINGTRHRPAVRPLPAAARPGGAGQRGRSARALRAGDGARRALLRDGRQPRQLAGQPLLGLPAGATTSRAGR